jgi:hypothetical protein
MDAQLSALRAYLCQMIDREVSERMCGGDAAGGKEKEGAPGTQGR